MRRFILPILLLAVVLAGCAGQPTTNEPVRPAVRETGVIAIQDRPASIQQQMAGKTGIVTLIITDEGFEPKQLRAAHKGRVRIYLRNDGKKAHNLNIPRWGVITRNMEPGDENYIEFTASEKGDWPFFSDAPGSMEPGLQGTLKVE